MSTPTYDTRLVAAILADKVYQSAPPYGVQLNQLAGWVRVDEFYRESSGYRGEAWAKVEADGSYSQIMQVNRGTVFTAPNPYSPLYQGYGNDYSKTLSVDVEVVFRASGNYSSTDPSPPPSSFDPRSLLFGDTATARYVDSAVGFANVLRDRFQGVPIIQTGQSLGGFTSVAVAERLYSQGVDVRAITWNSLPFTAEFADRVNPIPSDRVENFYIQNEVLTRQGILGQPIGQVYGLPSLAIGGAPFPRANVIHSAEAIVAQLSSFMMDNGWDPQVVKDVLRDAYIFPQSRNELINQVIATGRVTDAGRAFEQKIVMIAENVIGIEANQDGAKLSAVYALDNNIVRVRRTTTTWGDGGQVIEIPSSDGTTRVRVAVATVEGQEVIATYKVDVNGRESLVQVVAINGSAPTDADAAWRALDQAGIGSADLARIADGSPAVVGGPMPDSDTVAKREQLREIIDQSEQGYASGLQFASQIGSSLGSFLGNKLLDLWGVDNVGVRMGVGVVTSALGGWIGESLFKGVSGRPEDITNPLKLFNNIGGSLITSAVNMGGATLGRALVGAIGLQNDPLANGLASIFGGALAQRGAIEIVKALSVTPEAGLALMADLGVFGVTATTTTTYGAFGEVIATTTYNVGSFAGNLANAAAGFIGSFAGGKLAAALFQGDQQSIALGSSIGGTIGSIVGGLAIVKSFFSISMGLGVAGGPIGILVGAFIGAVLGGALGSLLGPRQSWGEVDLAYGNGILQFGATRGDGKALQSASQLAGVTMQLESSILGAIGGRLVGIDTLTMGMTESNRTIYARVGGFQYTGTSGEMALEQGALAQLKTARIAGGDFLSKQALRTSNADTRQELNDDLIAAHTYGLYADNKALFEAKLGEVMASRGGAGAWADMKARAEGVLDLDGAFNAAAYRAHSEVPVWNIGATTQLASIAAPTEPPPVPPSLGSAVMAFSAPLIAFDLNRDGVIAQGVEESGALFDIDGDGFREQTGWLTPWDAFLVFDRNHDGEINSIAEMAVSQAYIGASGNPLGIVLSGLDSDADGTFDADDAEFFEARLWTDRNLNGYVDLGELWSLTRFGIDHISLRGVAVSDGEDDYRDVAGNRIGWESAFGINGAQANNYGLFTTLSLAFNTLGVKSTQDPDHPGWFLLEHEGGESTAFGLGESGLGLVGNATFARTLFGSEGNDTLTASDIAGAAAGVPGLFIDGKTGDDVLTGGAADDVELFRPRSRPRRGGRYGQRTGRPGADRIILDYAMV